MTRSRKLKVHRANSQTISYHVRFSTDTVLNSSIFFLLPLFGFFSFSLFFSAFFCFVLLCMCFKTKSIYSDKHLTIRVGK